MDLTGTGIEIDPTGTIDAQDRADEFDAKLRERRGEFTGFYTQTDESKTKAMREINNHRGLSGNAQNMMEEIHAIRDAKMKLGRGPGPGHLPKEPELYGPYEEGVGPENFIRRDEEDVTSTQHFRDTTMGNMIHYMGHTQGAISDKYPADDPLYTPGKRASENIIHGRADDWYAQVEAWFNAVDGHIADAESTGISQGGAKAISWLARGIIGEPLRALRELQDADLTRTPSDSPTGAETVQKVGSVALNTGILSTVAPAPKGALRVFGGREVAENLAANSTSHLAQLPKKAMDKAEEMTLAGATDAEVRAATNEILKDSPFGGIHLGDDGKWRIEFSDAASKTNKDFNEAFKNQMIPGETAAYKLEDMFDMPFAKSLGLSDGRVRVEVTKANEKLKNFQATGRHTFEGGRHRITIKAQNEEQVRDVLLHELQHALQRRGGFEYGGSAARDNQYINPVQRRVYEQRLEASQDYNFAKRQNDAMWKEASIDAEKRGVKPAFKAKEWQTVEDMQGGYSFEQFSPHWQEKIARSEKMMKDEFDKLNSDFPWDHSDRFLAYQRLSGEIEARNVQTRKDLTAAQLRKVHPHNTEDVPMNLRHQWSDYGDPAGRLTSDSAGGFYGDKKMSAQDISTEERKLATSLRSNTVRKEGLERDLKSDRFNKAELERKQKALDKHNARIEELKERLTEVVSIKEARSMIPSRVNDVRESAVTPIQQGVPKTLSEDIGRMPKRRSKLERLEEDKETLETLINLETRVPRLDRAKKHLKKVESDLEKIKSGE